jgi:hypothetical protein
MWKSLNPGDKVLKRDIIRYRPGTPYLISPQEDMVYEVVMAEQHYFEIVPSSDQAGEDEPARKIIRYMDVGYHVHLEIWSGVAPLSSKTREAPTDLSGFK